LSILYENSIKKHMKKINVGVIGLGYWGPNYIRNFTQHKKVNLVWACDLDQNQFLKISNLYPWIKFTRNYKEVLKDTTLNFIAIATPPETHYKLCRSALLAGKHVLIAKPLATNSKEVKDLIKIAKRKKLLLHCDLTYLYTPAVKLIRNLIKKGIIGNPQYFDSTRTNLGLIQKGVNVIWDLALHDLAILDYCFNFEPEKVFAVASKHHQALETEELAHITISYPNNFIAHIHVSWLSPVKLRTIFIGGSSKMILFDDIQPDEKIKIYNKGIDFSPESISPFKPIYRSGDIVIPKISNEEALSVEIEGLVEQISKNKITYENAKMNVKITKVLEACSKSVKENRWVTVK